MRILSCIALILALFPSASLAGPKEITEAQKTLPQKTVILIPPSGKPIPLQAEIAVSDEERERGLMFRKNLPEDTGMLFLFPKTEPVAFWMKNTLIPLDILFLAPDKTIAAIARNAKPGDLTPLLSGKPVNAVLEIAGGATEKFGIKEGDKAAWKDQ